MASFLCGTQFRDQKDPQRNMFLSIRRDLVKNDHILYSYFSVSVPSYQTTALVPFQTRGLHCANCRDEAELPAICDCSVNT